MKFQMNFTTSYDDVIRFASAEDLKIFYRTYGCNGLEVMPLPCMDMKAPEKMKAEYVVFHVVHMNVRLVEAKNKKQVVKKKCLICKALEC